MRTVFDLKNGYEYAMHGNGAYKGLRQTNTRDALEHWKNKGVNIFEIDMAKTDDDEYVAVAHYLNKRDLKRLEIFNLPDRRTLDWFMSKKLFAISCRGGLQPLSLQMIVDFMKNDENIIVMFDLFGLFSREEARHFTQKIGTLIGSAEELWDRILIESYNLDMVDGINSESPRANTICCVRYEENEDDENTFSIDTLKANGVKFISYPWYIAEKHPGEIEDYSNNGLTVFSRSKDNRYDKRLKNAGVDVNILSIKYDGLKIFFQLPLYISSYIKRILVKVYIKVIWR